MKFIEKVKKKKLILIVGNESVSRTNPFEEGRNDRVATNPSNDPLHEIVLINW